MPRETRSPRRPAIKLPQIQKRLRKQAAGKGVRGK
jgi:hypothetical protein